MAYLDEVSMYNSFCFCNTMASDPIIYINITLYCPLSNNCNSSHCRATQTSLSCIFMSRYIVINGNGIVKLNDGVTKLLGVDFDRDNKKTVLIVDNNISRKDKETIHSSKNLSFINKMLYVLRKIWLLKLR